ncbi:MAG: hypothetical protein Q7S05_00025 [bacterium]|nr:hypothetical protein [bacterium]
MYDAVAISTDNSTFLHFLFDATKTNLAAETSYGKKLIIAVFVVEIKDSWISNPTSTAAPLFLVFVDPLIMALNELFFSKTIAVPTLTPSINLTRCR